MHNAWTAVSETDEPAVRLSYSLGTCLDHLLVNRPLFTAFFNVLNENPKAAVLAVQVTGKRLTPIFRGQKVRPFNGPQMTIALGEAVPAHVLHDATYNNAYGYNLLAAIHKRVCDASELTEARDRLYAQITAQLDIEALLHVVDRYRAIFVAHARGAE